MKKYLFIILLFFCISFESFAQLRGAGYFDGYWSNWASLGTGTKIKGNYDGFILYLDNEGPWEYRFKFTVNNMSGKGLPLHPDTLDAYNELAVKLKNREGNQWNHLKF
jgi:hypothetical protein